ncbi:MAG: hypothetical protein JW802_09390 [Campylobacterales bacterium]|nr:hypothetical protein [Campylobacterales bacterium]MBN2832009.1 hypothetical protein [Campylobacterales bacterium]
MQAYPSKIICECGQKSIQEAIDIFKSTTLPYKKAKKLVTQCNQSCCNEALRMLYQGIKDNEIPYEKIAFLIDQKKNYKQAINALP